MQGLLAQFDAEQDAQCAGWTEAEREVALLPAWRQFYHVHQQFRACCWRCREEEQERLRRPLPASISEDEAEQEAAAQATKWSFAVSSVAIRFLYLLRRAVQRRRAARRLSDGGQDVSDDDEHEDGDGGLKAAYRVRPTHAEAAGAAHANISDDDSEGEDGVRRQQHPALREEEGRLVSNDGQQADGSRREGERFEFTSVPHAQPRLRPSLLGHASSPAGTTRPRRHTRQYSDFGNHSHEQRPGVDLFRSSLSGFTRAEISSSSDDDEEEAKTAVPPVREEEEEVKEAPVVVLEPAPGYEAEEQKAPGYAGRLYRLHRAAASSVSSGGSSGDEAEHKQTTQQRGRGGRGRAAARRGMAATSTRPRPDEASSGRGGGSSSSQHPLAQANSPRRGGRSRPPAARHADSAGSSASSVASTAAPAHSSEAVQRCRRLVDDGRRGL